MEKQVYKPKLRFTEFKGEWEKKKLGEICKNISSGKSTNKQTIGEYKFYGSTGIIGYTDKFDYSGKTILIARVGANAGTLYIVEDNFSVSDNTLMINCYANYSIEFIFLFLTKVNLNKLVFGSGQPLITGGQLKSLEILTPTLPEQTKIASFLTTVDDKLQALKKKKQLLEQYKKGVMQKIFSQELRFKDDNGNDYPDWEEKKLGEVLVKNSKKNKNQEFKLVQSVSNKRGFVNQDEYFEDRIIASKDLSNYYVIQKGDFAYNPSRIDVGSLAYKFDDNISVISPLYISFKANRGFLVDSFLLEWFNSQQFTKQMNSSFEGSVRNTLSYESLRKMGITIPSIPEQTKIANFLSAIDDKIKVVEMQIEKMEVWKKGLLQQMFC
jgi:type I restriction enzyme, S subunit